MFANTKTLFSDFYQVLKSMEDSKFAFFLTGSRFFGGHNDNSDYDFFVLADSEVLEYLRSYGFESEEDLTYSDDPTFVEVFTLRMSDGTIQVQLIKSEMLARKMQVQRTLFEMYSGCGLPGDKSAKRELWQLTYRLLDKFKIAA